MVPKVPTTNVPVSSLTEVELSVISVGAVFEAEVFTAPINLNSIKPVLPDTSVEAAVLTCCAKTSVIEKIFFVIFDVKSVTVAIFMFTFLIAAAVSPTKAAKANVLTPVTLATSLLTCILISSRSLVLARSSVLSSPAFPVITIKTAFNAVVNASSWLAPEPSAAAAKPSTTPIICWLAISKARASAEFAFAASGLKFRRLMLGSNPRTLFISAMVNPEFSIKIKVAVRMIGVSSTSVTEMVNVFEKVLPPSSAERTVTV